MQALGNAAGRARDEASLAAEKARHRAEEESLKLKHAAEEKLQAAGLEL